MARRYSEEEVKELEDDWDRLVAFKEFVLYRLSPAGVKKFRDSHEVDGDLYDWMENRFGSMISAYSSMKGVEFEEAREALLARPYIDIVPKWKAHFSRPFQDPDRPRTNPERPKIKAKSQGVIRIEWDDDNGYTILFPDGSVQFASTKKGVEKLAKAWSKENIPPGYNAGMVELEYH